MCTAIFTTRISNIVSNTLILCMQLVIVMLPYWYYSWECSCAVSSVSVSVESGVISTVQALFALCSGRSGRRRQCVSWASRHPAHARSGNLALEGNPSGRTATKKWGFRAEQHYLQPSWLRGTLYLKLRVCLSAVPWLWQWQGSLYWADRS